jgi:ribokinase
MFCDPNTLLEKIKDYQEKKEPIIVMHDYFIDRIIKIKNKQEFLSKINEKTTFGGGSIRGVSTIEIEGGNAVNLSLCLAKLGLEVHLFTVADETGKIILENLFKDLLNLNLYISYGKPGYTTSLEFYGPSNSQLEANVMISDVGDNANFGPEKFKKLTDKNIIKDASAIIGLNWATNSKGTSLLKYIFNNSPNSLHFIDPADIGDRTSEFCKVLTDNNMQIDILSINENECNSLLSELNCEDIILEGSFDNKIIKRAAQTLAKDFNISVDLHTKNGSAFSDGKKAFSVSSCKVMRINNLTGAGDSWDAADILGYLINLKPEARLFFANVFAALYINQGRNLISLKRFIEFYSEMYNKTIILDKNRRKK